MATVADFLFVSVSARKKAFAPIAEVVHALLPSAGSPEAKEAILAHAFSNGGAGQMAFLSEAYQARYGAPLPVTATVFDSSPGQAWFRAGVVTFSKALPRFFLFRYPLKLIVVVLYFFCYTLPPLLGKRNLAMEMRDVLNSTKPLNFRKEGYRMYAFSAADEVIEEKDVILHAEQAKERGWRVGMERWEKGGHVGLVRVDEERYWDVVEKAWARRG